MDKNAIKKYAVWARRELIERVAKKAQQYGIEEKSQLDVNADSIGGKLLTASEKKQRQALVAQINDKGYEQVIEEVAYTWFNRISALRFMEVNGYLPTHVRVFTDEANNFKPQILAEAIHLEMDGLDMDKVFKLKEANQTDELYKYLLLTQCNSLNTILPGMFQKISDYTELLLPDNLLREGSVVEQMIILIEEDDWKDAVQIIGWLYQYYNSEKKDEVFAALKKNVKITKENIPAATQLFTPDWIVRYMVENSLGRLWLEGHPNNGLKSNWKYYLDEAEQELDVQAQLNKIYVEYKNIKPEEIKCIDPCSGSGHILAYMFDLLIQIYEAYGYTTREAATSIVENNIYGLDIDERAAQLANFAVMMKARQYDRRFFAKKDKVGNIAIPQPHVYAICDSNHISKECIDYFSDGDIKLRQQIHDLLEEMYDAKEYGSILNISDFDFDLMYARFDEVKCDAIMNIYTLEVLNQLLPIVQVAQNMSQKYTVVVTNPPYMGNRGMSERLGTFVQNNYPSSKSDMFAIFIERCRVMVQKNGYYGLITQPSFMFLSAFEQLRDKIINTQTISSLLHMGRGIFGIDFGSTAFVIRNSQEPSFKGTYMKLHQRTFQYIDPDDIAKLFISAKRNHEYIFDFSVYNSQNTDSDETEESHSSVKSQKLYYVISQDTFAKIPSEPIAYWLSPKFVEAFTNTTIGEIAKPRPGLQTGCNDIFIRQWYEVDICKTNFHACSLEDANNSKKKWFPYNKGGEFRKWYGNNDYVVNWENDGLLIRNYKNDKGKLRSRPQNTQFYFRECFSWSLISSGTASFRYKPKGHIFDVGGMSCFADKNLKYLLALCNSPIAIAALAVLAPTINFQAGDIANIPVLFDDLQKEKVERIVDENIELSKSDWDDFETSWDFKTNPLIYGCSLEEAFDGWSLKCQNRFTMLKSNEETLNNIFIDIYGLQGEMASDIEEKNGSIRKADLQRDIKGLISYAVGCMFGRYSLDVEGLAYAGGNWDKSKYITFEIDDNNIIPICDDEYFEDDIVGRFVNFIEVVYGIGTLQENLKFIADALGGKGNPKEIIRNYFMNDFYNDHVKMYQKRPIYWQFDSGKKNGFKCLIYMHRYQPDTIMRIRTDYVHEQQSRYRTAITDLEQRINGASTSERVKLTKKLTALQAQAIEIREYEEKIHHIADQMIRIDLDDGVKNNYEIFKDVLAKIK